MSSMVGSSRLRNRIVKKNQQQTRAWIKEKWESFQSAFKGHEIETVHEKDKKKSKDTEDEEMDEVETKKSSESTNVVLRNATGSYRIDGSTGHGCGHAEMDALDKHIQDRMDGTYRNDGYGLILECHEKPVCYRCATILGAFNVRTDDLTKKATYAMGSTQWSLSNRVKTYIAMKYPDLDIELLILTINQFNSYNKL